MRSTSIPPGHQATGALTIWTALAIAALVCIVAVLVFQVMEYLFYGQPPSVWSGAGPSAAPQAITEALSENTSETNMTPERVLPVPSTYDMTNAITEALSESASETNVTPEKVLPGPSTGGITNAGTEEKASEAPAASETNAVE